jgi:hypothetical protein
VGAKLELKAALILTVIHHGQEGGVLLCLHQLEGENNGTDHSKEGSGWLKCSSHSRHTIVALTAGLCADTTFQVTRRDKAAKTSCRAGAKSFRPK